MCYQHQRAFHAGSVASSSSKRPAPAAAAASSSSRNNDSRTIDLTGSETKSETCPVCTLDMTDYGQHEKVWMPCFHTICKECRDRIADHDDPAQRRCPMCKTLFTADVPLVRTRVYANVHTRVPDVLLANAMRNASAVNENRVIHLWLQRLQRAGPWPWDNQELTASQEELKTELKNADVGVTVSQYVVRYLMARPPHIELLQLSPRMQTALLILELLSMDLQNGLWSVPAEFPRIFDSRQFGDPWSDWRRNRQFLIDTPYVQNLVQLNFSYDRSDEPLDAYHRPTYE